jgi:2-polyprenyl-3-methyl-5-hydroxy-6-metoxy-1,4-benzoquinol methylase
MTQYVAPKHMWNPRERLASYLVPVKGKRLFDFGCGMGEEAMYFARMGAEVHAMDISSKGISITRRRAEYNALKVEARVGDVLDSGYPDDYFDLIHGIGILHHVGLDQGLKEVHRLLKPGGRAAFLEHMSNSGMLDWFRSKLGRRETVSSGLLGIKAANTITGAETQGDVMTAGYTDYERPLNLRECKSTVAQFEHSEIHCYSLLHRLRRLAPAFGTKSVRILDHAILSVLPPLTHYAGLVVICITKS